MHVERDQLSRPAEEEWIAKYRAAVSTAAMPSSRLERLCTTIAALFRFLTFGIRGKASRGKTNAVPVELAKQAPFRRPTQPMGAAKKPSKRAG